jgi:predicted ATPase
MPVQVREGRPLEPTIVNVAMGRTLPVPRACGRSLCWFKFKELFGAAVGAPDFIALVNQFHTIALQGVPIFTAENRSMGYRFVTFIDIAYEHRIKVPMSAEAYPADLFKNVMTLHDSRQQDSSSELVVIDDNLGFAKDRTISRMIEMQTMEYALAHSERNAPERKLALQELQLKLER